MDNIINAINELRQKLMFSKTDTDISTLYRLEGYLRDAEYYMKQAKRTVDEYKIEL